MLIIQSHENVLIFPLKSSQPPTFYHFRVQSSNPYFNYHPLFSLALCKIQFDPISKSNFFFSISGINPFPYSNRVSLQCEIEGSLETMAVNLTAGAIAKMLNGEVTSEKDMMPVLQVKQLKMIHSKLHQNQESNNQYKVSLSDGMLVQQGTFNTSLNSFVIRGNIQVGSILELTQYVCNLIQ